MDARPPLTLDLDDARRYAATLLALLGLFVLRVVGQVVVALGHPRWLPPMREWYSGLLPYPVLLPVQLLLIGVMAAIVRDCAGEAGRFGSRRPRVGAWLVWLSYVYAAAMVVRFVVWVLLPPDRRRAFIPIVFHEVLAAFLFVYGSWHLQRRHLRVPGERPRREGEHDGGERADRPVGADALGHAAGDDVADDRRQADHDERVGRHQPAAHRIGDDGLE
jgi:hypothetical protein